MDICRVCLSNKVTKDISELKIPKVTDKTHTDIMLFCLDIQIIEDTKITKKLCLKCFKKIIAYHKFKSLALKSDTYLRALIETDVKNIQFVEAEVKQEQVENTNELELLQIKEEIETKSDEGKEESDDEFLSVMQKIKYEYIAEEPYDYDDVAAEESKCNKNIKRDIQKDKAPPKKDRRKKSYKKAVQEERCREVCTVCGRAVWNLKQHSYVHMPLQERKRIKCKDKNCDKMFSSYGTRHKHYKTKHLNIKKHCDICNKDVISLKYHHLQVHDQDSLPFGCVACGRRFISQSSLDVHQTLHTKDRPYECGECGNKYRGKMSLMLHKRQVHEKEKSHMCQFCSKGFFKKYHLQVHLRTHTKEKPYKCAECGKFFSSSSILNSHKLIHATSKTFECPYCDSTFKKREYLRNHTLSHTKEKRYACKYCGMPFGRSDHRKRHEYTAHEQYFTTEKQRTVT